jgi:hypothetical protein
MGMPIVCRANLFSSIPGFEYFQTTLNEGLRVGEEGLRIFKWHDWDALGALIFDVHKLKYTEDADLKDPNVIRDVLAFNRQYSNKLDRNQQRSSSEEDRGTEKNSQSY